MSGAFAVTDQTDLSIDERKWYEPHWYAIYAKSRHEKIVHRELERKGIETFLPLRKVTRNWSDRSKVIEEPLFKGYLFARTPLIERTQILNTVGVVNFVGRHGRNPVEVPEKELSVIKHFLDEDIQVDPFPYLKKGQRVYIRSGPFKGAEGYIARKDRHCRLVISLDLLMQSVSIQIDQACVEPV